MLRNSKLIYIILLLGLILRLVAINQSLWLDEAIGAIEVRDNSFLHVLAEFPKFDNHPPLYYLTLKLWTDLFGYSEISLRFPSIIFGVATIWIVFLIGKLINPKSKWKMKNEKWKFPEVASLLLATSGLHIYYSQEARMYSMAAFLSSLAFFFFLKIIEKESSFKDWVGFSFSITALVFTDYMPVFLLPVFFVISLIRRKKKEWWSKYLICFLPLLFLGLLWFPIFLNQSQKGKWLLETLPGWKNVAGGANFKQAALVWTKFVFGRISLVNKTTYYSLVLLSSIPAILGIVQAFCKRSKNLELIFHWLTVPLTLGFIVSIIFPAFIYFRFLYVLPAFYLIIGWGVTQFNLLYRNILLIVLIFFNILSWGIYVADESQQREQWRQATTFIEQNAKKDDVVIFEYPEPFTPYRWYSRGLVGSVGATDSIYADPVKTADRVKKFIQNRSGIYYFEYLRDLSDPDDVVRKTVTDSDFKVFREYNFSGVGIIYYWVK